MLPGINILKENGSVDIYVTGSIDSTNFMLVKELIFNQLNYSPKSITLNCNSNRDISPECREKFETIKESMHGKNTLFNLKA